MTEGESRPAAKLMGMLAELFAPVEPHVEPLVVILSNCRGTEAHEIARTLVLERHAACVNVIPTVSSYYVWEGEFTHDEESTLLIKSTEGAVVALVRRLKALHSYDMPEIVVLGTTAVSGDYLNWVHSQVGSPSL